MQIHNQTCKNTMPIPSHLFLRRSSLVGLVLRPLLTRTGVSLLAPRVSELSVSTTLNGSWDVALLDLGNGNGSSVGECGLGALGVLLLGGGDLLLGGVSGLGLASLSWEKDEASTVSLEALDVQGEGFDGEVLAAGVNGDTDGACKLAWDGGLLKYKSDIWSPSPPVCTANYLKLLEGETTSGTDTAVVLDRWAADNWSQLIHWARGNSSGLGETCIAASELATWLLWVLDFFLNSFSFSRSCFGHRKGSVCTWSK